LLPGYRLALSMRCSPLRSLATGSEKVRAKLAAFLNKLLGMGVDGFRIDAAKREYNVPLNLSNQALIRSL
jgi:hypothetical protein